MNRWDGKHVSNWNLYMGSRCIVITDLYSSNAIEVKVLEVSPKGRVKFQYPSGHEGWEDKDSYLLIEKLIDKEEK